VALDSTKVSNQASK